MNWLDKVIKEYEIKNKTENACFIKNKEKQQIEKRRESNDKLNMIYENFLIFKESMDNKKYPCKVALEKIENKIKNETNFSKTTLFVMNNILIEKVYLSETTSPFISFIPSYHLDSFILKIKIKENQEESITEVVPISSVTPDFVNQQIKKFVMQIFQCQ